MRQFLMEVLEVGPSLLIGLVPLILLVLFHYAMLHILKVLASLLGLLEPGFQVGELLADLVQHLVEGAVLGIVLVKLGLVSHTLLHRQYGGIGRQEIQVLVWTKLHLWGVCMALLVR